MVQSKMVSLKQGDWLFGVDFPIFFKLFLTEIFIYQYIQYSIEVIRSDTMIDKKTTMQIHKSTLDALDQVGERGQTYEDIIRILLHAYDKSITFDNYK